MAFEKKVWKDRIAEYPTRRNLVKAGGSTEIVTVERNEGNVSQEGDAFSAENMNDLERRIEDGLDGCPTSVTIKKIETVSALPPDAADHPDTMYLIID